MIWTTVSKAFDFVDHNKLWKILKKMGILDHLTCLLRNLYACQESMVSIRHGTKDWFKIGKGVCQDLYCYAVYSIYIQSTSCQARWRSSFIIKEINPQCSLEGLMVKFQYFGHIMWRSESLEKTLMLGKIEGRRRKGRQRMWWLHGMIDSRVWANSGR